MKYWSMHSSQKTTRAPNLTESALVICKYQMIFIIRHWVPVVFYIASFDAVI